MIAQLVGKETTFSQVKELVFPIAKQGISLQIGYAIHVMILVMNALVRAQQSAYRVRKGII